MHNWWIATLEHKGIIARDEAEHISNNIKNSIHKEVYKEAYDELGAILDKGKFDKLPVVTRLEADVAHLKDELAKLKAPVDKVVAKPKSS